MTEFAIQVAIWLGVALLFVILVQIIMDLFR